MTPNGSTVPPATQSAPYNKAWCDERHRATDAIVAEMRLEDARLHAMLDESRDRIDARLGETERLVARYSGGVVVLVILIEVAATLWPRLQ